MRTSVAMTGNTALRLVAHLLREDAQEDLCFATWRPSTGHCRKTALIERPILPRPGERHVHGNASFQPAYSLRAAQEAASTSRGLAFIHSHPGGNGWQRLNSTDRTAEARIANLARELTGLPLVGVTLAGDQAWSARFWDGAGRGVSPLPCESVRVVGDALSVTFNDEFRPKPAVSETQVRTVHTWGEEIQATIARLRVAVAGVGSVGMAVAEALARTGIQTVGVFDFDTVELVNLDRLRGAQLLDALLKRPKTHVAQRLLRESSTATQPQHEIYDLSICEHSGLLHLLDFDLVFACVDRPWPRHVLNTVAYADLIPVVEGGLRAFRHTDGSLRNAYWRSTIARPGRPCLACLGQYDPASVQVERDGSLDDPTYIANLPPGSPLKHRENVAALSLPVAAALLQQFVSYVAHPSGIGDPGPLRFSARDHLVLREATKCVEDCPYAGSVGNGDDRLDPASRHLRAEQAREARATVSSRIRVVRRVDDLLSRGREYLPRLAT